MRDFPVQLLMKLLLFNIFIDIIPERNRLENIIPVQEKTWEVSFNLIVKESRPFHTSLMHFTQNSDMNKMGDRTPALFLINEILHIAFSIGDKANHNTDQKISLNKEYHIQIMQVRPCSSCPYKVKVFFDGIEVYNINNNQPRVYKNVKCYFGDPWYSPSPAIISNLAYKTQPSHIGKTYRK